MKAILLAGAALASFIATPLFAQPQPRPAAPRAQPQTFDQMMQAEATAANQRQARDEAAARAMLDRDLQVGNMTPAQQDQLREFARNRMEQAVASQNLSRLSRDVQRDVERFSQNVTQGGDRLLVIDPATGSSVSDRQFAEAIGSGVVNVSGAGEQFNRDIVRTVRPLALEMGNASADIMRERERLINSNPNVSAEERQAVRGQTQRVTRAVEALPSRLDQAEYQSRERERQVREAEERIIAQAERVVREQGRDPTAWTPTTNSNARPVPPRAPTVVLPVPPSASPPASPAPAAAPAPASGPSQSASGGTRTSGQRGTIPGQNGDPYAGLRVPASQGGTGAETPQSRAAAQARAQQQAEQRAREQQQAQAERNQSRTDRLRQEAMDRAHEEDAQIDLSAAIDAANAANRAAAQANAEYEAMLETLRRASRPGQVGRGGGSGSGGEGSGGGGSYDDQMADGDGFPDGIPSIVEWMGGNPASDADTGQFGSSDAFRIAQEASDFAAQAALPDAWRSFELGGTLEVAELLAIYDGYDLDSAPPGSSGRSLSSAGTSLSSAGNSLSSAGMSLSSAGSMTPSSAPIGMRVDWNGYNLSADPLRVSNGGQPEPGSYAAMLLEMNGPRPSLLNTNPYTDTGLASTNRDLATALYGPLWSSNPYQIQHDPNGQYGRALAGYEVASLFDTELDSYLRMLGGEFDWLRAFTANDRGGLDRLLAQPFNVLLTWGTGAYDLDLHMTGPLGEGITDRFHIYYAAPGQLAAQPFAQLIKDCICASGSEVVLTSALNRGGVYRVSVFNYGNQSGSSTNLANASLASIQIVRGGTAVSQGNGTTIVGGRTLLTVIPPANQPGNTWIAAEIDPRTGRITAPQAIVQTSGDANVR